jgi:signal transduction histidine kinase/ActR/RegA family two-component response regulator
MRRDEVRAEQVRTIYRQSVPVLATNCVNALIVVAVLWSSAPRLSLACWVVLMGLMTLLRAGLARQFHRQDPPASDAAIWARRFLVGSAVAGVLWGAAGFSIVHAGQPMAELLVIFMVGGMCTAAAGTLAAYLPAFVVFASPAVIGLALGVARLGEPLHQLMAGVVLLYGAGLFVVARVNHRALTEAFALRVENADLVACLERAHARLEDSHRDLERRVAERTETLRKQAEVLRDARRLEAIGRLAGGVAHDFNNLLTILLGNISELSARRTLDARMRSALSEMRDGCLKGADLVRQLLTFGRRQPSHPETLDLNQVIGTLEGLLRRLLSEQTTLRVDLEPCRLFVLSDPTQLEQVIVNLVTNARDAVVDGGIVSVESHALELLERTDEVPAGKYVELTVSDTGTGMDAETRQHIFEPFFTTKEVGKGTGLGLATVHGIVEQSGGYIRVTSTLGGGSCFRVYLPAAARPAQRQEQARGERRISGMREVVRSNYGATILLVDDEPTVRAVARRILNGAGYQVLVAADGAQALSVAAAHDGPLDLLLTDVVMAGFDGPELAGRLRAVRPDLRTLFMSGYSRHHAVPADEPSERVGFLAKPFTYESLLAKVAEVISATPDAQPRSVRR